MGKEKALWNLLAKVENRETLSPLLFTLGLGQGVKKERQEGKMERKLEKQKGRGERAV